MNQSINEQPKIFISNSGKKEKQKKNDDKLGWYAFLFFIFMLSYAYFAFVYFK
jgi:hypothetical protein